MENEIKVRSKTDEQAFENTTDASVEFSSTYISTKLRITQSITV